MFINKYKSSNKSITKIIAVILTVTATLTIYYTLNKLIQPVPVVVAARDINTSSRITEADIKITSVSKKYKQPETHKGIENIIGMYAAVPIFKDQQVINPQLTDNPDKLATAVKGIRIGETIIALTTSQALWPQVLRDGDLVTVMAVIKDEPVKKLAVGQIIGKSENSTAHNVKRLTEAESINPKQTEINFKTDNDGAKRIVEALPDARIIYLLPRHPGEGEGYGTSISDAQ